MNVFQCFRRNGQKGQSMAEFIVVIPVLALMLYSVLYFGQSVVFKTRVAMAARYVTLKTARDFSPADINECFFADLGGGSVSSSTGTFPWMNAIGLFSYFIPFASNNQILPGLVMLTNPNVWDFSTTGEVSYQFQPPGYLDFIGSHQYRAGLMVDGNPWAWPTLNWWVTGTMELFLASYALSNGWDPWALPTASMLGFPRWWAWTPWFPLPPWPRLEF